MAKRGGSAAPLFIGAGIVALVWLIAREKLRNPRCKSCDVELRLLEVGGKYLCPACGDLVTVSEILFGLA